MLRLKNDANNKNERGRNLYKNFVVRYWGYMSFIGEVIK